MEANYFYIDGYWKSDKENFEDYMVCDQEHDESQSIRDDEVFYYGLTEFDILKAIEDSESTGLEFVITAYTK